MATLVLNTSTDRTGQSTRGSKFYELSNHLGNVLATVSDMKLGYVTSLGQTTAEGYKAQVQSASDYFPFGWAMSGRQYSAGEYRFGFNGKENDTHWGDQLIQDYGFRLYNPAVGKFFSTDPLTYDYPFYTPYQFAGNDPIKYIDLDGLERALKEQSFKAVLDNTNFMYINFGRFSASSALGMNVSGRNTPRDLKIRNAKKQTKVYVQQGPGTWRFYENSTLTSKNRGMRLILGLPSEALQDISDNYANYEADCATACQLLLLEAARLELGDDDFNKTMTNDKGTLDFYVDVFDSKNLIAVDQIRRLKGKLYQKNSQGEVTQLNLSTKEILSKAAIGSQIVFKTDGTAKEGFESENILKVGEDEYYAHPFGYTTYEQLMQGLSKMSSQEYYLDSIDEYQYDDRKLNE